MGAISYWVVMAVDPNTEGHVSGTRSEGSVPGAESRPRVGVGCSACAGPSTLPGIRTAVTLQLANSSLNEMAGFSLALTLNSFLIC